MRLMTPRSSPRTEEARPWIAVLRLGRDAADLDETKSEPEKCIGHLGILVEACRQADRIRQRPSQDLDAKGGRIGAPVPRQQAALQRAYGEPVCVLGIEARQQQIGGAGTSPCPRG
jgi:hypothetical protein